MSVVGIQASVRPDGLTAGLARAALDGAASAGVAVELVHLGELTIRPCQACPPRGWGQCREGKECIIGDDDFQALRSRIVGAEALVFATPVYFGDLSESAKVFLDRLRRTEWPLREQAPLKGKPVVGIAAAGGSGRGSLPAIANLERYMTYLQLQHVVYLPVSRQNQELQLRAAYEAGVFLARRYLGGGSAGDKAPGGR